MAETELSKSAIINIWKAGSANEKRADHFQLEFEEKVGEAKSWAWWMAFVYTILRKLSIGSLTWAATVLLGGFLTHLSTPGYVFVSFILVLEGLRVFVIQTVTDTLHKDRFRESSAPREFKFLDMQMEEVNKINKIWQGISMGFSGATAVFCIIGCVMGYFPGGRSPFLFYSLALVIAILNCGHAYAHNIRRHRYYAPNSEQNYLMYFYDEVYRTAIQVGLGEGDRLDLLEFAFTKLASDFKRNIRPQLIQIQNKDLIRYLYLNQQGIAMVCEALKSPSNVWRQVVAANLPGFWVDEDNIQQQLGLFWALGERLHGAGKDAEGALNSIQSLALSFATNGKMKDQKFHPFLLEYPAIDAGRSCIVSRLVQLVCSRVRPTMVFQIRALEACCQSSQVVEYLHRRRRSMQEMTEVEAAGGGDKTDAQELYATFEKILENKKVRGKVYFISTWVALLSRGQGKVGENIPSDLKDKFILEVEEHTKNLKKETNIWLNEVLMTEGLRKMLEMTEDCQDWENKCIRSNTDAKEIEDVKSEIKEYLTHRFSPKIPLKPTNEIKP